LFLMWGWLFLFQASTLNNLFQALCSVATKTFIRTHHYKDLNMIRTLSIILFSIVLFIGISASVLDAIYGGGEKFPDRTTTPTLPSSALETIANLDYPPGNLAVTQSGRIFFTFHPEGFPPYNIAELVNGKAKKIDVNSGLKPGTQLHTVLSMRADRQNRLWLLDYADHGKETPQLIALDIDTLKVIDQYQFPSDIAGFGSHLNDFQVSQDGSKIYIANASILGKSPSLIIYDVLNHSAREVLKNDKSVKADYFVPYVEGMKMLFFGVFAIRPGVDSIALDRNEEWLYFAPVTEDKMHRIRVSDLNNTNLTDEQLSQKVEDFGEKTMSDGITTDDAGNVYLSDLEHSAIVRMKPDGSLETLIKDPKIRWPDGFSFGPDGWLYVSASSLQFVIAKPDKYIAEHGPYQIFRFKTDSSGFPGQ